MSNSVNIGNIKVAVVSALFLMDFDKMDTVCNNFNKIDNWHYYLFTNDKQKCGITKPYTVKQIDVSNFKYGVHATKNIKWLTHKYLPGYNVIIWVDSFIHLNDLKINSIKEQIIKVYENPNNPIAMRIQSFKCVDDDIEWCLKNKRIDINMASNIKKYLIDNKYPSNTISGTYWSSAIIKNNKHKKLQELSENLYNIVSTVAYRDQHWLPFLFDKYKLNCDIMKTDLFISKKKENYNETNHHYIEFIK